MEELIWKYIDNHCSEDELQEVIKLLTTDAAFKALYDECVQLNDLLIDHAVVPISPAFKTKMVSSIESQLNRSQQISSEILPRSLVIVLSIMAITSITVAILYNNESGSSINLGLQIDDRSMSLAIWSMASFICLVSADYVLKRIQIIKKQILMIV